MVTDYERAWGELAEFVAGKTQHGREGLLTEMAAIQARCRVPAGELSRLLRLYGVEVERARAISTESDRMEFDAQLTRAFDGGPSSPADSELAGRHRTEEVHDGRRNDASAGTNGRRRV